MRRELFAISLLFSAAAFAGDGTTGAASLKLAGGARGHAMGEAFTAVADGAESLSWNPAGLIAGAPESVVAGFEPMAESVSRSQASASVHRSRWGAGAGYDSVSAGSLDAIDTVGNKTGTFQAKDQTFVLGGAIGGPALSGGLVAKMWTSQIDGKSASSLMADLGLDFRNPFFGNVRHGLAVRHLGAPVSYISQKDPLPTTSVFGTAVRAGRRLLVTGDYGFERAAGSYLAAGAEWTAVTSDRFGLALRGGYNTRRREAGSLAGATAGAGISWRSVSLDYAWIPFGDIGDTHAFTLRIDFGEPAPARFASAVRPSPPSAPVATAPSVKGKVTEQKSQRRRSNTLETAPIRKPTLR